MSAVTAFVESVVKVCREDARWEEDPDREKTIRRILAGDTSMYPGWDTATPTLRHPFVALVRKMAHEAGIPYMARAWRKEGEFDNWSMSFDGVAYVLPPLNPVASQG